MMMMMMISGSRYLRSFVVRSSHQQHRLLTCFGERDVRNSGKRRSVRWKSTLDSDNECVGVNLSTYPIHRPGSKEYDDLIEKSREDLRKTGCATFENFWNDEVVERATNHVAEHASTAFETDNEHNAYQLSGQDDNYADTHPRNVFMRTRVASLAYDELEIGRSPLYDLYNSKHFVDFVRDVTSQNKMYRLADKLGACSVNIFRPGWVRRITFSLSLKYTQQTQRYCSFTNGTLTKVSSRRRYVCNKRRRVVSSSLHLACVTLRKIFVLPRWHVLLERTARTLI